MGQIERHWGSSLKPSCGIEKIDEGNLEFTVDGNGLVVNHSTHGGPSTVTIDESNLIQFTIPQRGGKGFRHYEGTGIPNPATKIIDVIQKGTYTLSTDLTDGKRRDQVGDGDWVPAHPPSGKKQ
jgi:hypothetical protein